MQPSTTENRLKIRPPPSVAETKNDPKFSALRAQLEIELRNKKQCGYQSYDCSQLALDGYKYCMKHILEDKSAPFKPCSYVYAGNGKRCQMAAPKIEKRDVGYCNEHALKTTLIKNRQSSKCPPPQSAEVLLYSLGHYVKKPRNKNVSSSTAQSTDEVASAAAAAGCSLNEENLEQKVTKGLDPFKDIDSNNLYNSNNILDLCSESDSDVEAATFASVWHDPQVDSSDNESIDSEQEDVLKHAGIYTAEEISLMARDKLVKLQSLYIEQYRHLQHIFKERRRKYIQSLKREKETCCNIYNQIRENPKEQRLYKKLKAYNKYHKTHLVEAILNKRMHDSRAKVSDGASSSRSHGSITKCIFTEGGVKCGERALPTTRYCRKHILEDPHQVLFKACGSTKADVECTTPVEAIFDDACCRLHMDIPVIKSYAQLRKNSESDFEDSYDAPEHSLLPNLEDIAATTTNTASAADLSTSANVKTELIDYKPSQMSKTLPSMLFEESSLDYASDNNRTDLKEENLDRDGSNATTLSADEGSRDADDLNIDVDDDPNPIGNPETNNICDSDQDLSNKDVPEPPPATLQEESMSTDNNSEGLSCNANQKEESASAAAVEEPMSIEKSNDDSVFP